MESHLINLALLETLKCEKFKDEIDLFLPFVAVTIQEIGKPTVEISDIQLKLSELFGFRPPLSAIKVLTSRAKNKGLLIRENHAFIPQAEKIKAWSNGYEKKKQDLEVSLDSLKKSLIEFSRDRFQKNLSLSEAEGLILKFIQDNVSATISRRAYEKAELDARIKNADHIIASFVGHIHRKEPYLLEHFSRCVKGMLLAEYLYFADKVTSKKNFEKISVYLDSPLIIGLLGFNGPSKKQANEELIGLLKSLKIKICIFDKTFDEIEGLLSAWKYDFEKKIYKRFNTKTLELLRSQGYDAVRLDTEIKTLRRTIESKGITIKYGFSAKERYQCDEVALEKAIAENFHKDKDLTHDTICISRIHNMRENRHIKDLDEQFSVFVTGNMGLAKHANGFFDRANYCSDIPVVVSEQWLTIIFWLKNPNISNKLPTNQVIATAYSLLYTDDKFWDAFLERLESITKRGDISEEDFILVRWDSDLLSVVHDVSVDVGEDFSEEDIFDIVEGIKRKYTLKSEQAIEGMRKQTDEELARIQYEANQKLDAERSVTNDLARRHAALIKKIEGLAGGIAVALSFIFCLALLASLIIACVTTLPSDLFPDYIKNVSLPPALIATIIIITAAWGILSWTFGLDIRKVNHAIKDWIATRILNHFTN
ncbi:hypothetical protein LQR31_13985 [Chromobacterium vaccinii]|uniref:hypothetical protein n=1 Tax=Chromobacterium vaccinii TaxID=1108595 RepID=UPI001E45853E|nr:hypothetical protein [Chromobacterium vaccinii]MCD4485583.1 hypothetical protein [Chromobacterium vaccinii]